MDLPVALALLALLISVFAVLAAFATYARLRALERTALRPGAALLSEERRQVPAGLWPRGDETASMVLLLDATCPLCRQILDTVGEAVDAGRLAAIRAIAAFPTGDAATAYSGQSIVDITADPDLWQALHEGYTPCLYLIDRTGRITDRRFVYGDTDVAALVSELAAVPTPSGSSHAT